MTIGELKKLIAPFANELPIIVAGPCLDDDGDEEDVWFNVQRVERRLDEDTADEFVRFACSRLDDFQP